MTASDAQVCRSPWKVIGGESFAFSFASFIGRDWWDAAKVRRPPDEN